MKSVFWPKVHFSQLLLKRDTAVPSWKLRRGETDQVRKWRRISGDEMMKGECGGGGGGME